MLPRNILPSQYNYVANSDATNVS